MNDIANVRIDRIVIGERHRKNLGRIEELAGSIAQLGLLQPIGIDASRRLIFGARRIAAFEHLGRKTIPARVIVIDDLLDGEHAENLIRKDFTKSERVAIGKSMAARLGDRHGGDRRSEEFQTANNCALNGDARDLAAEYAGFGNHETYRQAEKVCDEAVPELVALMDDEGISVSAAARLSAFPEEVQRRATEKIAAGAKPTEALRQIRREDLPDKIAALPEGQYPVIYADPAWEYSSSGAIGDTDHYSRVEPHYPTQSLEDICALDVKSRAAPDAVLFLWVPSPLLEYGFQVIERWGFGYKASFVWDKMRHNHGNYNSVRHEFLLICTRGSCTPECSKLYPSVVSIERGEHSEKPAYFREMIDALYPSGARIELYARGRVPAHWHSWGNEAYGIG
jgi:N6-adenosine-specific RNA methylase IME4/ParB-like chromosome segregation protein Spo0J